MGTMIQHRAAVLGHPIAHSLSPLLHQAAYRALGLDDWSYEKLDVSDQQLASFLAARDESWAGLSLTMPLKREVLKLGQPCDNWSAKLGIANTLVFDRLVGQPPVCRLYNTDVGGIEQALGRRSFGQVLIIGSGSTAVSAAAAISELGARSVTIASRDPDQVPTMQSVLTEAGIPSQVIGLGIEQLAAFFSGQTVGQATNQATSQTTDPALLVIAALPPHACDWVADWLAGGGLGWQQQAEESRPFLLDVAYDPSPTRLVAVWTSLGGQAVDGKHMLFWQAVEQVHLMTGEDVGTAVLQTMREAIDVR